MLYIYNKTLKNIIIYVLDIICYLISLESVKGESKY